MRYGSVCSGIEAATVAWHPLGWVPAFFSEIEKSPRSVLTHRYPSVPLHGDFTTIQKDDYAAINLLVGGTPCQSYSVAGLRKGLDDPRGNLMLEFGALARRLGPKWLVWENVPGVLSSNGGRDFGTFLGMLGELGYGFAYRVLDAQYFGVPQRRKRVFVVGYFGDWRPAAAVLFERHSLSGDSAPSRKTRESFARGIEFGPSGGRFTELNPTLDVGAKDGPVRNQLAGAVLHPVAARMVAFGEYVEDGTASAMKARDYKDATDLVYGIPGNWIGRSPENGGNSTEPMINVSPCLTKTDQHAVVAMPFDTTTVTSPSNRSNPKFGDPCHTIQAGGHPPAVAFQHQASVTQSMSVDVICPTLDKSKQPAVAAFKAGQGAKAGGIGYEEQVSPTLTAANSGSNSSPALMLGMQVRRLTPRECERLQGFPDDYTNVPGASDSARYKALGNSMAVPVMHWIGDRINKVDQIMQEVRLAA